MKLPPWEKPSGRASPTQRQKPFFNAATKLSSPLPLRILLSSRQRTGKRRANADRKWENYRSVGSGAGFDPHRATQDGCHQAVFVAVGLDKSTDRLQLGRR